MRVTRRETVIQNSWEKDGKVCHVFWHYTNKDKRPYITIEGYNPFPFFAKKEKLFTSMSVFNDWMNEQGWTSLIKISDIIGKYVYVAYQE